MDKIELAGFTAEQTESIREAARKYAERTTFTVEEATEKILDALNFISGAIREAFDKLTAIPGRNPAGGKYTNLSADI